MKTGMGIEWSTTPGITTPRLVDAMGHGPSPSPNTWTGWLHVELCARI